MEWHLVVQWMGVGSTGGVVKSYIELVQDLLSGRRGFSIVIIAWLSSV